MREPLVAVLAAAMVVFAAPVCLDAGAAGAATLRVPEDHASLQKALDAAQSGDLVLVAPGVYAAPFVIRTPVTLASWFHTTGDPSYVASTVLQGRHRIGNVVEVAPLTAPGTLVTGFTIRSGRDGLRLFASADVVHNVVRDNIDAVDYEGNETLIVSVCRDNVIEDNKDDGIDLDHDVSIEIEGNTIRNNGDDGIEIRIHRYEGPIIEVAIRNNVIEGNRSDGIQLIDNWSGVSDRRFMRFTIRGNLIRANGKAGIGFLDEGRTVEDFTAGNLVEEVRIFGNTLLGNDHGISGGDSAIVVNNLFVGHTTLATKSVDANSVLAWNLFFGNVADDLGSNLDAATTYYADPALLPDATLAAGSPAVDVGATRFDWKELTVLDLAPSEYAGAAPDLGAFERGDGAAPSPPPPPAGSPPNPPLPNTPVDGVVGQGLEPAPD
jgi:hypothetical protein